LAKLDFSPRKFRPKRFHKIDSRYKDLFLQFMKDHPEEVEAIGKYGKGRTRDQLLEVYRDYQKASDRLIEDAEMAVGGDTLPL
jgi:hypothetical protein